MEQTSIAIKFIGYSLLHIYAQLYNLGSNICVPSSDTQGLFRSLHQPLGQLVEFPSMYRWMNAIISLVSSLFSDEQDYQWKRSLQERSDWTARYNASYWFSVADSKLFYLIVPVLM